MRFQEKNHYLYKLRAVYTLRNAYWPLEGHPKIFGKIYNAGQISKAH